MAIGSFKLPNVAASVPAADWTRPTDWLAMPTIGTQEFIGLLAITDDESNHIALLCAGAYTVDWGDGVTENVATGVKAQHTYTYSAISSGTLSTRGYKQVLVRVTPQAGQNLTTVNLQQQNSIIAKGYVASWLDIDVNGSNITTLTLGGGTVRLGMCERFTIGSIGTITNFSNFFATCYSLQSVNLFNTASGTTFTNMFQNCASLKTIPLINTALGTTFNGMFNGCFSLQTVPLLNTVSGTIFTNMFASCYSLQTIPLFNSISVTAFNSMFSGCSSLQFVPLLNTVAGTNFSNMFTDCSSLQLLPNFNTAAGTNFSAILSNNLTLAKGAFQGTRYAISYTNMCLSQSAIVDIFNGLGTAVGTPTIIVSGNPGYAGLTIGERLIATAKGFTIA